MIAQRKDGKSLGVLILAAGQGTRMVSSLPKVLHGIAGKPMLFYPLRVANALKPAAIGIVVGHESGAVKAAVTEMAKEAGISRRIEFIQQKETLGSGNAVLEAVPFLKKFKTAVVLCGDSPLLTYESLYGLLSSHEAQKGQATLLTAKLANPKSYGRIVRGPLGEVLRIVEDSVASPKELAINEVNSGAYCFEVASLLMGLKEIGPKGPKREQFLTDIMELVRAKVGNFSEIKASRVGAGSKVPHLSYIGDSEIMEDVNIGAGTITCNYDGKTKHKTVIGSKAFIGSNVNLVAPVKIGRGARIGAGSTITEDVPDAALAIARARQVNKT